VRQDALAARKRSFILFIRAAGSVQGGKRAPRDSPHAEGRTRERLRKGETRRPGMDGMAC